MAHVNVNKEIRDATDVALGKFIATKRSLLGIKRDDFAHMLNVSRRTMEHYEKGKWPIPSSIVPSVAEILGVTVNELFNN